MIALPAVPSLPFALPNIRGATAEPAGFDAIFALQMPTGAADVRTPLASLPAAVTGPPPLFAIAPAQPEVTAPETEASASRSKDVSTPHEARADGESLPSDAGSIEPVAPPVLVSVAILPPPPVPPSLAVPARSVALDVTNARPRQADRAATILGAPSRAPAPAIAADVALAATAPKFGRDPARRGEINAPDPAPTIPATTAPAAAAATPPITLAHHLDLARTSAWLDTLARDIAASADNSGRLRFALIPETLGRLDVDVQRAEGGVHIHLTTSSDAAHDALSAAQPRLFDALRAHGVRLTGSEVSAGSGDERSGAPPRPPALIEAMPLAPAAEDIPMLRSPRRAGRYA